MLTTAYYFLQVILCSAFMMGYYWLMLRNKRFHQYNRFYLLAVALLSWMVPLLKIQWSQSVNDNQQVIRLLSVVADNNSELEEVISGKGFEWNWDLVAAGIYVSVAALLFLLVLRSFFRLYHLLKTHSYRHVDDVYLIFTHAKGTPFSFFRYIFWNEEIDMRSESGKQILQHELTHVRQKHSIDKIFIQCLLVAGWFNPFFWLLRREMDMIHEFIADKKAVNNGDTASLAQMLLTAAYPQQKFALTHPFFFSPINRRLTMLANDKNPRFTYVRRLIILPLLAIVVVLFAFRNKDYKGRFEQSYTVVIDAGHGGKDIGARASDGTAEKDIVLALARKIKALNNNAHLKILLTRESDVYQAVTDKADMANAQKADLFISLHCNNTEAAAGSEGRTNGASKGIDLFIASKEKAKDYDANYRFANYIAASLAKSNELNGIRSRQKGIWVLQAVNCPSVLVEAGFLTYEKDLARLKDAVYQEQFANAILKGIQQYFSTKETNGLPVVDTAIQKLSLADVKKQVAGQITAIHNKKAPRAKRVDLPRVSVKYKAEPLVMIDGKKSDMREMHKIAPDDISSIAVLKDEKVVEKYGNDGKNGVIEISLKHRAPLTLQLKPVVADTVTLH